MNNLFDSNVSLLRINTIPSLFAPINNIKNSLTYDVNSASPELIRCDGKIYSSKYCSEEISSFRHSILHGPRLLCPRLQNKSSTRPSAQSVLDECFDAEGCFVISALQFPKHDIQESRAPLHWAKTILCLGSASLVSLLYVDIPDYITNIVIVENDPKDLAVSLSVADIKSIGDRYKVLGIGLSFIIETDPVLLEEKIHEHLIHRNPLHLNGILLHKTVNSSSGLAVIESWLRNPEGISQHVAGFFGGEVDEINQVIQSVYNHKLAKRRLLLKPNSFNKPIILVASGPSLDKHLELLKDNSDKFIIFASGSALGSLLRNGIQPDVCCFLERQSVVYHDIKKIVDEGFELTNILLVCSITVDPRICQLFRNVVFFHRPASSSLALFSEEFHHSLFQSGPHSVNAALEAALFLGAKKVLCLGCDFGTSDKNYPRSSTAIGESPRSFPLPVRGRSGKTVYTNPELVYAKINFSNAIAYYNATAYSPAYGVETDNLTVLSEASLVDILPQFYSSEQIDINNISSPCKVSSHDLINTFKKSTNYLSVFVDEIYSDVQLADKWNLNLSRKLDLFFNRDESSYVADQIFVSRLINYTVYVALQPFHDADGDMNSILYAKSLALENLSWIREIYSQYFHILHEVLNDDSPGFSWSIVRSLLYKSTLR